MNLLDKPVALPGSCVMPGCGSASRDKYVDTGLQFDFYGAVYICNLCLGEMARLVGWLEPEYVQQLRDKLEEAENDKYLLQRQVDGLRMVVDGFTLARGAGGTDSVNSALSAAEVAEPESPDGETSLDSREEGPPESVHDEGVAELSDDDGSDGFRLTL